MWEETYAGRRAKQGRVYAALFEVVSNMSKARAAGPFRSDGQQNNPISARAAKIWPNGGTFLAWFVAASASEWWFFHSLALAATHSLKRIRRLAIKGDLRDEWFFAHSVAMGKNSKKKPAAAPAPQSAPQSATVAAAAPGQSGETPPPFYVRHPMASNVIFAAFCVYVAMLCLLALDQTFHWGIFGPAIPPTP